MNDIPNELYDHYLNKAQYLIDRGLIDGELFSLAKQIYIKDKELQPEDYFKKLAEED
jgi:hypothetical protein